MLIKMLLIFDYDGVIADSFCEAQKAFNNVADEFGLPHLNSKEEFKKLYNDNFYASVRKLGFDGKHMKELVKRTKEELDYDGVPVFTGMREVIKALSKDHDVAIVTSNGTPLVRRHMESNGLHVDMVLGADVDPDKTRKITSLRDRYPGETTYYIGDTAGDMKEGREAGTVTVGVTWGFHEKEDLDEEEPDHIVDSPEELLALFLNSQ